MSNNSAAIGTMLKTLIASFRADKAEKELQKINVAVKETQDGITKFRDSRQILLDIALQAKYTEQDIQAPLLAISGGKFQWSKVSAMMSNYQEIIKNWELAIGSKGFTSDQIVVQMDTISRKFQTLKDNVSGVMMNAGNSGLTQTIKDILDGLNQLLRVLNSLSSGVYSSALSFGKLMICLYAGQKLFRTISPTINMLTTSLKGAAVQAVNTQVSMATLSQGMTFAATKIKGALTTIRTAFASNLYGLAILGISEAIGYAIEEYDKLNNQIEISAEKTQKEYAANAELIDVSQKRIDLAETLCNSYLTLKNGIDSANLSDEKRQKLQDDIAFTEEALGRVMDKEAVNRIKNSDNVAQAVQEEKNKYVTAQKAKVEGLKNLLKAELTKAHEDYERAVNSINNIKEETDAYITGKTNQIRALEGLAWAEQQYYQWKAKASDDAIRSMEANRKIAQDEYFKNPSAENAAMIQHWDDMLANEYEYRKGVRKDEVKLVFGEKLEEMEKLKTSSLQVIGSPERLDDLFDTTSFDKSLTDPMGGDLTNPSDPSGGSSSSSPRTSRHTAIKDPAVLALKSEHDSIISNSDNEISSLQKYADKYGASESITMQIDKAYDDRLQKLNDNLYSLTKQLEATSDGLLTTSTATTTEGFESFLNAIIGQESGGDYGAIGVPVDKEGHRALGKYQIMDYNWADWAEAAGIGRDADWRVPANQDAVAYHMLKPLYDKYGADGAAVAWYAGEANAERWKAGYDTDYWGNSWESSQGTGPSIADYVRQVMARNVGTVAYSQTLQDLGVSQDDWYKADLTGKKNIISNLRNTESVANNEEAQKFLDVIENCLLEIMSDIQSCAKDISNTKEKKDEDLLKNSRAEVEQAKTKVAQENATQSLALGLTIRDLDTQRMKLKELKVAYEALNKILPRFNKETKAYKELLMEAQQAQLEMNKQQKAVIESMYDRRAKLTERRFKGKGNPEMNQATQELTKAMVSLGNLQIKHDIMKKNNMLNQDEEWELSDQIEEAAGKVKEAMNKYKKTVMDSLESVAEQFVFDGKELKDIFNDAWTALGRDAMKLLFGQQLENPSMLTQLLGVNKADVNQAKEEATKALMDGNTDALGLNTDAIVSLTEATNRVAEYLGINIPPNTMGVGGTSEVGKSYFASPALSAFAQANDPSLGTNRYSFDSVSQLPWSKLPSETGISAVKGQYTFNTMSDKLVSTNDKLVTGMSALSNNMITLNATSQQGTVAEKESTKATGLNTNSTLQLVSGLAGIGNAFANGDWFSGLLGIAQMGMGLGWFGAKAYGGAFATGGNMATMSKAGKVTGAGSGRSDSILAYLANKGKFVMLSNGEYVINEKSAKALGYDTLDQLNGYSTGGDLGGSPTNPTPYIPTINSQVAQKAINIHSGSVTTEKLLREQNRHMIEQNTLLKGMGENGGSGGQMVVLNTQASSADVLKALQDNPRAVQAILGRQNRMGFR